MSITPEREAQAHADLIAALPPAEFITVTPSPEMRAAVLAAAGLDDLTRICPEHRGALADCEPIHEARYNAEMTFARIEAANPDYSPRSTWHGEPYDHSGAFDGWNVISDADPGL